MSRWRRLHYSASLAVIVAALAAFCDGYFRDDLVGFVILLPGIMARLSLEYVLTLLLLTDGDLYAVPSYVGPVVAAAVYCAFFYVVLQAWVDSRGGGRAR
jgi:hypothetical protein